MTGLALRDGSPGGGVSLYDGGAWPAPPRPRFCICCVGGEVGPLLCAGVDDSGVREALAVVLLLEAVRRGPESGDSCGREA
jgi:hypothetical protein